MQTQMETRRDTNTCQQIHRPFGGIARGSNNISKAIMTVTTVMMITMAKELMRMMKSMVMPMMMKTMLTMHIVMTMMMTVALMMLCVTHSARGTLHVMSVSG
jgi:hypothetical protein